MDARGIFANTLTILLTLCAFAVASGVLTGKAFYCRDPDTGKLYPVNSTWHSSSFCGRYTCKLRKKASSNPSQAETFNKYDKKVEPPTPIEHTFHKNCSQPVGVIVEDKVTSDIQKILHKPKDSTYVNLEKFKKVDDVKDVELNAKTPDGDRYLTEEEITALSLLLQTMKKSDLEAILEVYNLAQDIYREIDKVTEEKINATLGKTLKQNDKKPIENEIPEDIKNKKIISYWYEPLTPVNIKLKAGEIIETSQEQKYVKPPRVKPNIEANLIPKSIYEGLNLLEEAKRTNKLFESVPKTRILDKSYIEAPLGSADFRKLPYYHPLTNFQKQASYVRPTPIYSQPNSAPVPFSQASDYTQQALYAQPAMYSPALLQLQQFPPLPLYPQPHKEEFVQKHDKNAIPMYTQNQNQNVASSGNHGHNGKCCKNHPQEPIYKLTPWKKVIDDIPVTNMKYEDRRSLYQSDKMYDAKSSMPYSESKMNPNFDLPMAYVHDYNISSVQPYNLEKTWRLLGLSDKVPRHHKPPYMGAPFLEQAPNKLTANSEEGRDVNDEEQEQVQNANKNNAPELPDWQTAQLPMSVLNEVKANIAKSKFLPYPFKKKVKLERVGKLLKLDEVPRIKRDVATANVQEKRRVILPEEYEVYIEKSTCETDTEPGFFRMGNITEPYPACCPQRIQS